MRQKIEFIRSYRDEVVSVKPGEKMQVKTEKANDLIGRKIARIYEGSWPPKAGIKSKINLKDLK